MNKTIAELESALAFWENVRWTAKGAELKAGAHKMVLSVRADLAKAREAQRRKELDEAGQTARDRMIMGEITNEECAAEIARLAAQWEARGAEQQPEEHRHAYVQAPVFGAGLGNLCACGHRK